MKKRYWIVGLGIMIVLAVGALIYYNVQMSMVKNEEGTSISIIGGSDGPTSIFLAGKVGGEEVVEYTSITMEEAKEIFKEVGDYLILDVRRTDEFVEGHIPGAINVVNEEIGGKEPEELPDKNQVIYVYCRSGRRSKEASAKLAALGYKNIIEFGGILDWTGEIEK